MKTRLGLSMMLALGVFAASEAKAAYCWDSYNMSYYRCGGSSYGDYGYGYSGYGYQDYDSQYREAAPRNRIQEYINAVEKKYPTIRKVWGSDETWEYVERVRKDLNKKYGGFTKKELASWNSWSRSIQNAVSAREKKDREAQAQRAAKYWAELEKQDREYEAKRAAKAATDSKSAADAKEKELADARKEIEELKKKLAAGAPEKAPEAKPEPTKELPKDSDVPKPAIAETKSEPTKAIESKPEPNAEPAKEEMKTDVAAEIKKAEGELNKAGSCPKDPDAMDASITGKTNKHRMDDHVVAAMTALRSAKAADTKGASTKRLMALARQVDELTKELSGSEQLCEKRERVATEAQAHSEELKAQHRDGVGETRDGKKIRAIFNPYKDSCGGTSACAPPAQRIN